ncbi:MAG: type II toxin-antitoxin system VapC family toxin [Nitrospira sp.]|nr:type II toxin-antitoxin system VapC family toxin [Nitrospira sp.]MDH4326909.1 type II toxin-antitoxin system VapC family toxin [Nitrospira sp.]
MDVTPGRFVLDTNAVLYFLGGRLAQPLPDGSYCLSVMSELELLAYPDLTPSEEAHIKAFLQDITIVELNDTVKAHAIDLRKRYRLKLPYALIVATALAFNATLLTNDEQLLSLAAVPTQVLKLT